MKKTVAAFLAITLLLLVGCGAYKESISNDEVDNSVTESTEIDSKTEGSTNENQESENQVVPEEALDTVSVKAFFGTVFMRLIL